jgi:hypothetical protein
MRALLLFPLAGCAMVPGDFHPRPQLDFDGTGIEVAVVVAPAVEAHLISREPGFRIENVGLVAQTAVENALLSGHFLLAPHPSPELTTLTLKDMTFQLSYGRGLQGRIDYQAELATPGRSPARRAHGHIERTGDSVPQVFEDLVSAAAEELCTKLLHGPS